MYTSVWPSKFCPVGCAVMRHVQLLWSRGKAKPPFPMKLCRGLGGLVWEMQLLTKNVGCQRGLESFISRMFLCSLFNGAWSSQQQWLSAFSVPGLNYLEEELQQCVLPGVCGGTQPSHAWLEEAGGRDGTSGAETKGLKIKVMISFLETRFRELLLLLCGLTA